MYFLHRRTLLVITEKASTPRNYESYSRCRASEERGVSASPTNPPSKAYRVHLSSQPGDRGVTSWKFNMHVPPIFPHSFP